MNKEVTELILSLYFFTAKDTISKENLTFSRLREKKISTRPILNFVLYYNMELYKRSYQFLFDYYKKSKNLVVFIIIHDI